MYYGHVFKTGLLRDARAFRLRAAFVTDPAFAHELLVRADERRRAFRMYRDYERRGQIPCPDGCGRWLNSCACDWSRR